MSIATMGNQCRVLNQATKDWYTSVVTLSETKGLSERFFAEFILSVVEGLRMTIPAGRIVKRPNIMWVDFGLLFLSFLFLMPQSSLAHSVSEIAKTPEAFNQQSVTVVGEVTDVVTRYGEKPYTIFTLRDGEDVSLPVFVWGIPTFKQGQIYQVAGTFVTEKVLGVYALKRGIEAAKVEKVSAAENRAGSTLFKRKKRTGIGGARGFYIPQ